MIHALRVKDFTRFGDEKLIFSPGLNVFVGANGTGKSHLLKLLYASMRSLSKRKEFPDSPTKTNLEIIIANRLKGVFKPDALGRLARRCQGFSRAEITLEFGSKGSTSKRLSYAFSTRATSSVQVEESPHDWEKTTSVFLPTRELLSLYSGFVSTFEEVEIPFEETWYDLALQLGKPLPKGPHKEKTNNLLRPLEHALDGKVLLENGRFYVRNSAGKMEAHLLAEGLRKIGTLAQLVANRSLTSHSVLFWDEPEANLNPLLIELVASTIMDLVKEGMQVFIATHSLFLLRQLYILAQTEHESGAYKYFAMNPPDSENSTSVVLTKSHSMVGLGEIAALTQQERQEELLMDIYRHGC